MKKKIIQIIPAPANIVAVYEDAHDPGKAFAVPVVCLALVEYDDGSRIVEPMLACETYIDLADSDGFLGLKMEAHHDTK